MLPVLITAVEERLDAAGKPMGELIVRSVVVDKDSFFKATADTLRARNVNRHVVRAVFAKAPDYKEYCMWPCEFEKVFGMKPGDPKTEDKL